MPTEWARDNFDQRWKWVVDQPEDLPANVLLPVCMTPQAYEKFRRHHAALAFWEDAQAAGLKLDKVHYHFHPRLFVETFKKCGWLSEGELTQTLPMSIMRPSGSGYVIDPVTLTDRRKENIQKYRVELNRSLRKYGIASSPLRMAAFFGNAAQETQWFGKLYEDNPKAKYYPWDGRGFLQLTWPGNYIEYWQFRGRRIDKTLEKKLVTAHDQAVRTGSNESLQDSRHPGLTAEILQWWDDVNNKAIDAAYSAGTYWARTGAAQFADQPPALKREIQIVNNVVHVYYSCVSFGQVAATVNIGKPVKDTSRIARVYGIVSRYQAYINALVVLDDYRLFPYSQGQEETPEGYERRKF